MMSGEEIVALLDRLVASAAADCVDAVLENKFDTAKRCASEARAFRALRLRLSGAPEPMEQRAVKPYVQDGG